MFKLSVKKIINSTIQEQQEISLKYNNILKKLSAKERILWSLENLPEQFILSSSFGIQSMVSLHLIIQQCPNIPVVLIDTGYLFPETYRFIDRISKNMDLNLKIFRSALSAGWQEARYGKLWNKGIEGMNFYNIMNKVHPMKIALKELSVNTWFSGLRKVQSESRKNLSYFSISMNVFKILPILDWTNKDIHDYMKNNNLEYHPLWEKGYSSVGDIHTTTCQTPGMSEEKTRFFGLKRECGLHDH